jgi:hypothetical protein
MDHATVGAAAANVPFGHAIPDLAITSTIRIEYFTGTVNGIGATFFTQQLANADKMAGTDTFYFSGSSGLFDAANNAGTIAATRANVLAHLVTASAVGVGGAAAMRPAAVLATLSDAGTVNTGSRVLKRDLEAEHGLSNIHWGFGYFLITMRVSCKTVTGSLTKELGFLSAYDNLNGNGHNVHTEQRIMADLQAFINALELDLTASHGVTGRVNALASRWVIDFIPDFAGTHNCRWMFLYISTACAQGTYRVSVCSICSIPELSVAFFAHITNRPLSYTRI